MSRGTLRRQRSRHSICTHPCVVPAPRSDDRQAQARARITQNPNLFLLSTTLQSCCAMSRGMLLPRLLQLRAWCAVERAAVAGTR
jgi:hypothetical protein